MRQEMFTASRGEGAYLENRRMRVSRQRTLEGALIATGFPYRENLQHLDAYMAMMKAVMQRAAGVRRPGSAALDLAYVAAGRVDGFWEIGLKAWDTAAGTLLIREAGGLIGTLTAATTNRAATSSPATRRSMPGWSRRSRRSCRSRCARPERRGFTASQVYGTAFRSACHRPLRSSSSSSAFTAVTSAASRRISQAFSS